MTQEPHLFRWPLNSNPFTWLDRLKMAKFFLTPSRRWTQGEAVEDYERAIADYVGTRYAVFTSSGSTANTIIAMYHRDRAINRNVVVVPAVTWQTSVSPWVREGFTPHFIDANRDDFSMSLIDMELFLRQNSGSVACVFITSVLGYVPDMERIDWLSRQHSVPIVMDNCESAMSRYAGRNISSIRTSTISTYFSHHLQSVEGGFVLTNDCDLHEYALLARNHGMVRGGVRESLHNGDVDPRFDFHCLGNNFRGTDITATLGLMDLKRAAEYATHRVDVYKSFRAELDLGKFELPLDRPNCEDVPLALPIIRTCRGPEAKTGLISICNRLGIESRPIISGNLLRHTAYKRFRDDGRCFCVADHLHNNGIYVGLGMHVTKSMARELALELNQSQ